VKLRCERALVAGVLRDNVALEVDDQGTVVAVGDATGEERSVQGLVLPGMPNLHSHAFQRAMAGNAEVAAGSERSFWGWREQMYRLAAGVDEEALASIAAWAGVEMLEAGYTGVAEFHYLHGAAPGMSTGAGATRPGDPASPATALSMCTAAREGARLAGIRQLLLPTLYQQGNFDGHPLEGAQRRFGMGTDAFLRLFDELRSGEGRLQSTGIALHSLRAVPPGAIAEVAAHAARAGCPVHIHVAEQPREVDDCLAALGARPVRWLLESGHLTPRWCLVHATHVTPAELAGIAASGAVVGLCPSTEANLGDGRFPLDEFIAAGGRFGIGSDSNASIDPREELRTLEYTLRLWRERRTLCASASDPHVGSFLYQQALAGGAQACGGARGLEVGAQADLIVLDTARAELAGVHPDALLDAWVFAPRPGLVRDVWVSGIQLVRNGHHVAREALARRYRSAIAQMHQAGIP
jgi:formimidoylglutamate deiminase